MSETQAKILRLTEVLIRACRSLGFRDYMPEPMIGHFVRQAIPASFAGGVLELDMFYKWVRQEYPVPDHVFSRAFAKLFETAEKIGVKLRLPKSFDPSFDEVVKEFLRYDHDETEAGAEETLPRPVPGSRKTAAADDELPLGMEDADEQIMDMLEREHHPRAASEHEAREQEFPVEAQEPGPEDEDQLRRRVEKDLRSRLLPLVYEEVRQSLREELRAAVEAEVRAEAEAKSAGAASAEKVAAGAVSGEDLDRMRESVREELRRELWAEVREEVKEDLRTVLTPVLREELRQELGGKAQAPGDVRDAGGDDLGGDQDMPGYGEAPDDSRSYARAAADGSSEHSASAGLAAEDQLEVIRRIREELEPRIRGRIVEDLAAIVRAREEMERRERIESRLDDPDYCLEKISDFLFPDQPVLWEKVRPFVNHEDWKTIVRLLEEGGSLLESEKINSSRAVIRDALMIKAEIEEEMNFHPGAWGSARGIRSIRGALGGAEQILDFALRSISEIIEGGTA